MNATPMSDAMHAAMNSMPAHLLLRLTLAAALGGIIGIERELKHRAAGLRTNMFICFGAAMFTVLSIELAGGRAGESTRIAAQIISGIGFIRAEVESASGRHSDGCHDEERRRRGQAGRNAAGMQN